MNESRPLPAARTHSLALPRVALRPHHAAVGAVTLLAAVLNMAGLASEGVANTYYAAAVKSMALNWHNFWFAAFDPGGFLAVDKPPVGLWLQVASVKLFGFNGVSLLAPQAAAGTLSVLVLYRLVARTFGTGAGLPAALALAVTPIAVVDNHNNTSDSVLILVLLLAVWAGLRAMETGRARWLLASAAIVGFGFNVKELEAYLVVPAIALVYLVGAPVPLRTRLVRLAGAAGVLLAVSLGWIAAVDLTPVSARPYVSDSGTNSELSLALGYNGVGRLLAGVVGTMPRVPFLNVRLDLAIAPGMSIDIGSPGALRLFLPQIGAQAGWLLPPALVGALVFAMRSGRAALAPRNLSVLLWVLWLIVAAGYFTVARFYHLYYLVLLAPPVAALAGIGGRTLWQEYRDSLSRRSWRGWLLPVTLLVTGAVQLHFWSAYTDWMGWAGPVAAVLCLLAAGALILGLLGVAVALDPDWIVRFDRRSMLAAALLGAGSLLMVPAAFAAGSVADNNGSAWLPQAGPTAGGFGGGFARFRDPNFRGRFAGGFPSSPGPGAPAAAPPRFSTGAAPGFRFGHGGPGRFGGGASSGMTFAGPDIPTLDSGLIRYLESHRGNARYLVATPTASYASLFILRTGQPVMTLGGYQGWDKILSLQALEHDVAAGAVRYFLLDGAGGNRSFVQLAGGSRPGPGAFFGRNGQRLPAGDTTLASINDDLTSWVESTCRAIPASRYSTTRGATNALRFGSPGTLYDCAGAAR